MMATLLFQCLKKFKDLSLSFPYTLCPVGWSFKNRSRVQTFCHPSSGITPPSFLTRTPTGASYLVSLLTLGTAQSELFLVMSLFYGTLQGSHLTQTKSRGPSHGPQGTFRPLLALCLPLFALPVCCSSSMLGTLPPQARTVAGPQISVRPLSSLGTNGNFSMMPPSDHPTEYYDPFPPSLTIPFFCFFSIAFNTF